MNTPDIACMNTQTEWTQKNLKGYQLHTSINTSVSQCTESCNGSVIIIILVIKDLEIQVLAAASFFFYNFRLLQHLHKIQIEEI